MTFYVVNLRLTPMVVIEVARRDLEALCSAAIGQEGLIDKGAHAGV